MPRKNVLITVTTYPLPSRSYDELVCTAGLLEDGSWIRIYPVPFKFLSGLRSDGIVETYKFTWIEIDLNARTDDFRKESHSPSDYSFKDIIVKDSIQIKGGKKAKLEAWRLRKEICTKNLYTDMTKLIADSQDPQNTSLATFKPTELIGFDIEDDDREWKTEWVEQLKQLDMFAIDSNGVKQRKIIDKIPFKFFYKFKDCFGRQSRLMIEDWEIGQLYFKCYRLYKDEKIAIQKVREKYWDAFKERDLHFFLGTTKQWHMRRSTNPFVIIGVFYPPHIKEELYPASAQMKLF